GALVGIYGIEHGVFEVLQGDTPTEGLLIDAIGPAWEFWPGATEPAFSILPTYFLSGVLAIALGIVVTLWALLYIERKNGPLILFILGMLLFLCGGGSPPLFTGTLACVAATRIGQPMNWWRSRLSDRTQMRLVKTWPLSLIAFFILSFFGVWSAIVGYPLAWFFDFDTMFIILMTVGNLSIVFIILAILSAIAYDIQDSAN
ncbi:MAG: hypothetical protein ACFFEJ_19090, partial [Candidatus Thorarchaeota archaeon]